VPAAQLILEINPSHPIVLRLGNKQERFSDWAVLLYEQALLAEGGALEDPAAFVKRMNSLLL
jgi:molecular chaperone HtpG